MEQKQRDKKEKIKIYPTVPERWRIIICIWLKEIEKDSSVSATYLFLTLVKSYVKLHSISSLKCGWDKWLTDNWTRLCKISWYLLVVRRSTVCQSWKWEYILVDLRNTKKWRYYAKTDNNWQKMGRMENSVSVKMTWYWRNNCRSPIYMPASSYESK